MACAAAAAAVVAVASSFALATTRFALVASIFGVDAIVIEEANDRL